MWHRKAPPSIDISILARGASFLYALFDYGFTYKQQESKAFNWIDTGIIIGMLTALGYVVAYSYQKGFLSYFGVDEVFISEMPLSNIIISITAVSLILIFLIGAYNNLESIFKEFPVGNNPIWLMFRKATLPLFIVTVFWLGFIEEWKLYLFLLSIIILYYFVYPVFLYWEVKGYKNKIMMRYEELEETGFNKKNISLNLKYNPSFKVFLVVVIFFVSYFSANLIGLSQAKNKDEFLIYKTNDNEYFVVIANVGDRFITSPINLPNKEISKKYQVIDQKSNVQTPLIFEKVKIEGGIKVNKTNTRKELKQQERVNDINKL
ncbi:hypothetical protein [Oceanobacillus luteolus]|uniref:Uncharacterized protein n=1 Tax=Oceanobacillus luteolus TaxID=1274358 RepID=A0ABW4HTQ2_9BACI